MWGRSAQVNRSRREDRIMYGLSTLVATAVVVLATACFGMFILKRRCRYCKKPRLPFNLLEVQPNSYICRKCANEKAKNLAFRGIDLFSFCKAEEAQIENGQPVCCFDDDVGHFIVGEGNFMNFYLPIEKDEDVRRYVEFLKSFSYPHIPELHKKAWYALSYLTTSYHRAAGHEAELTMDFYEGLRKFKESRGED